MVPGPGEEKFSLSLSTAFLGQLVDVNWASVLVGGVTVPV